MTPGLVLLTAENIQSALESSAGYGTGNVTVEEVSTDKEGKPLENGDKRYLVKSTGTLAEQGVPALESREEIGTVETKVLTPGETPSPDGELYVTAENLGDVPVQGGERCSRSPYRWGNSKATRHKAGSR